MLVEPIIQDAMKDYQSIIYLPDVDLSIAQSHEVCQLCFKTYDKLSRHAETISHAMIYNDVFTDWRP